MPLRLDGCFVRAVPEIEYNADKDQWEVVVNEDDEEIEGKWMFLFVDLVFVALISKFSQVMERCALSFHSLSFVSIMMATMFITRLQLDDYCNRFFVNDLFHRFLYFAYTMAMFIMSLNINANPAGQGLDSDALCEANIYGPGFPAAFVASRGITTALYTTLICSDSKCLYQFAGPTFRSLLSALVVMALVSEEASARASGASSSFSPEYRMYIYLVGVLLEVAHTLVTYLFKALDRAGFHCEHCGAAGQGAWKMLSGAEYYLLDLAAYKERIGAFLMMILGESVINLVLPYMSARDAEETYKFTTVSCVIIFLYGLEYFDAANSKDGAEHALTHSLYTNFCYTYVHLPLAFGMFFTSAGMSRCYELSKRLIELADKAAEAAAEAAAKQGAGEGHPAAEGGGAEGAGAPMAAPVAAPGYLRVALVLQSEPARRQPGGHSGTGHLPAWAPALAWAPASSFWGQHSSGAGALTGIMRSLQEGKEGKEGGAAAARSAGAAELTWDHRPMLEGPQLLAASIGFTIVFLALLRQLHCGLGRMFQTGERRRLGEFCLKVFFGAIHWTVPSYGFAQPSFNAFTHACFLLFMVAVETKWGKRKGAEGEGEEEPQGAERAERRTRRAEVSALVSRRDKEVAVDASAAGKAKMSAFASRFVGLKERKSKSGTGTPSSLSARVGDAEDKRERRESFSKEQRASIGGAGDKRASGSSSSAHSARLSLSAVAGAGAGAGAGAEAEMVENPMGKRGSRRSSKSEDP